MILVIGIKESADFNSFIVIVKVCRADGLPRLGRELHLGHHAEAAANWTPFLPANTGHYGDFGWSGIATAAGVIFFAYIGFDAVSTAAQESTNPRRDMPIGILGSLVICTILYILVAWRADRAGEVHQSRCARPHCHRDRHDRRELGEANW